MENNNLKFISSSDIFTIKDNTPYYTCQFIKDDAVIGIFDFSTLPATFVGDVDESAKILCNTVLMYMPQIIEKYK